MSGLMSLVFTTLDSASLAAFALLDPKGPKKGQLPGERVCPTPPPGVDQYVDMVMGWGKYGVLAVMGGAALACVGMMLLTKLFPSPRMQQAGAVGIAVVVGSAILYAVFFGILGAVVGNGC